jgi:hypothetical protein
LYIFIVQKLKLLLILEKTENDIKLVQHQIIYRHIPTIKYKIMSLTKKHEVVDHLRENPPLIVKCPNGQLQQNYGVISCIFPVERVKERFLFEGNRFLYHDVNKQIIDTTTQIARGINTQIDTTLAKKSESLRSATDPIFHQVADHLDQLRKSLQMSEEDETAKALRLYQIDKEEFFHRFDTYKQMNFNQLEKEFNEQHGPESSIYGVKVSGAYETLEDCTQLADQMAKAEPAMDHFKFEIGKWIPLTPDRELVLNQVEACSQLNDMMGKLKENKAEKDDFFEKRKQDMIDKKDVSKESEIRKALQARKEQLKAQRTSKK